MRLDMAAAVMMFVGGLVVGILIQRRRAAKTFDSISGMLDEAIAGKFQGGIYDETRFSQIEAKLKRFLDLNRLSKKQLERDQSSTKTLISDISHQTKTPIANIILYASLLAEQGSVSKEAGEMVAQISSHADKLNFLIQSLIKTSRLESGIISVHPVEDNIGKLLGNVVWECTPKAKEKGVRLIWDKQEELWGYFDFKWTAEALYNILDNAVKYTPEGGTVAVSVTSYEMFQRIVIKDTGIGISEEEQAKIFLRFWRSPSVSEKEGVGIGLYLAREIVTRQGGYVKVESRPGEGTAFSVFLPRHG